MADATLLFYTPYVTPRVEYIVSTLLPAAGIKSFSITTDEQSYKEASSSKINYSDYRVSEGEVWLKPTGLLFEEGIQFTSIDVFNWEGSKVFFKTEGTIPFDLFAAAFYLITRYEEYLGHQKDMYGRYAHENSLAYREGFMSIPLVNIWLRHFSRILKDLYPSLVLNPPVFQFLPTYDIDIAWSYKHKGLLRNIGGLSRSLVRGKVGDAIERASVLINNKQDPFDSYDWLNQLHTQLHLRPIYFFLAAKQNGVYDKNILPSAAAMADLIREHSNKYDIGVHPSWLSGDTRDCLKKELDILTNLSGKDITRSRQHYIRLTLPDTYRQLIKVGIKEDYSMGYGSINGFRASYCLPFKWYDLQRDETTELTIYPFCYMDANSYYEQQYSGEQALEEMLHYYKAVRDGNGLLITIWHNHFLGTDKMFAGWRDVYQNFISTVTAAG